jgi:hypothetical protein
MRVADAVPADTCQMLIDGSGRRCAADVTSRERESGMRTGGRRRRAAATRAEWGRRRDREGARCIGSQR